MEREHAAELDGGAEAPRVVGGGEARAAVVGDALEILLVVARLKNEVGVGAVLMHPGGVELHGVLIQVARAAVGVDEPFLVGVCIAERSTHEPGGMLVRRDQVVHAHVNGARLLPEAVTSGAVGAVLGEVRLRPGAVLRAVADFAEAHAQVLDLSVPGERLAR